MILAFLLAALSPLEHGNSQLVEAGHNHDWVALEEDQGSAVWWDRNSILSRSIAGRDYPTVVMRFMLEGENEPFSLMDVRLSVDCEANLVAPIDTYLEGPNLAEPLRHTEDKIPSDDLPGWDAEATGTLMRAVCGQDWTL